MKYNIWEDSPKYPITELLSFIVDNRGKTVPTAENGHKLIATNCVTNNTLFPVYEKVRYLNDDTYQNWFRAHPVPGDILFVCKGTPGRVCMVPDPIDFCIAQDMIALRTNERVYNKYLFAVLRSQRIQQQITQTSVGDVIPHFKKQYMPQLMIPLPEMGIQRTIGDFYYTLSYKVEHNKRINDNLLQQALAIFTSWFIRFDQFSGIKPDNWETTSLDNLCSLISRGVTPKYDDASDQIVINQKCIRNHMLDLLPARRHRPKAVNEKWLKYGDLLINSTGEGTLGRSAQVYFEPYNMTVDSHVTIVRPAQKHLIFYVGMWGLLHEREIEALHTGSTGQTELPRERLKSMEILLPDRDALIHFDESISPMAQMIIRNQRENARLALLRDSLLPRLMSGEIDVSSVTI